MSKQTILLEFDRWDCDRLSLLLTENGLSDCCEIIKKMKITGREFLELTEIKLLAWRNFSPKFRKNALITFIEDVKKNPEKYVKKSSIPRRTMSSEKPNDLVIRNGNMKKNELKHSEMLQINGRTDSNNRPPKTIAIRSKNVSGVKIDNRTVDRPKIGSKETSNSSINNKANIISRSLNRTNNDSTNPNFSNWNPNKSNTSVTKNSNINISNRSKNNSRLQAEIQMKYNQRSRHASSDETDEEIDRKRANQFSDKRRLNKPSPNSNNRSKNNVRSQAETQIKYNQRSRHTSSDEAVDTRSNQSHLNKSSRNINNTRKDDARMQTKTQLKYDQKSRHRSSDESGEEIADSERHKFPQQCPLNKSFLHNVSSVLEELSKKQPPSISQKSKVPTNLHKDAMKSQGQSRMNNSIETEDEEEVEDIYEAVSDEEEFDEPIYENLSRQNNSKSDEDDQPIYEDPSWKDTEPNEKLYQNVSTTPPPLPAKLNFNTTARKNETASQDVKTPNADLGLPIAKIKNYFTWGKRSKNESSSAKLINKSETNRVSINQPTKKDSGLTKLNPFSGRKSSLPIINNQTKKLPEPPTTIPKLNLSTFDSETSLSSGISEESLSQACNRKISAPSLQSLPGSAPKQTPIEQHSAFHDTDRAEATKILKTLPDGNYLFRPSSKEGNACVLSVVCRGVVYHLAVLRQEDGRLSFGSDEDFDDLRAIIHFYKKQSLKLLYDGDAIGTVSLTKGVSARKKLN